MDAFHTNILLRGPTQKQVVGALTALRRDAFVSGPKYYDPKDINRLPPASMKDIAVVYDRQCEKLDVAVLEGLARKLTSQLHCPGLAGLGFDGVLLLCSLFKDGRLSARYVWTHKAFGRRVRIRTVPAAVFAERLCQAFGLPEAEAQVAKRLAVDEEPEYRSGAVFLGWPGFVHGGMLEALFEGLGVGSEVCSIVCNTGYTFLCSNRLPVWRRKFLKVQASRAKKRLML